MLSRLFFYQHSWQVWEKIHNHFYAHLKTKIRQLKSKLKSTKKGAHSINENVTRIQTLANSLTAIGVFVSEQDLCDIVLDGLLEEYNSFVILMYKSEISNLSELKSLLMIQESQFDRFKQELVVSNVTADVAHLNASQNTNQNAQNQNSSQHARYGNNFGRGCGRHGRGRGHGRPRGTSNTSTGNRPTCQLCGKYGHFVMDC